MEPIDAKLLDAQELLHYCQKFQDHLFAFYFERAADCESLLTDLRVLHTAKIRQVLFCHGSERLLQKLELWNRSGQNFLPLEAHQEELLTPAFVGNLQRRLAKGAVPIILLNSRGSESELKRSVISCAVTLGATKIFFPGPGASLEIEGRVISCPNSEQLEQAIQSPEKCNYSPRELRFLSTQQDTHDIEMVRVEAKKGDVFKEVFTHFGSGTLFTKEYPDVLRQAHEKDVLDILGIMQPYVRRGTLKDMTEDEVLDSVSSFTLYTVNKQIVALAALWDHEDCFELAKLCTLPRYQARGRARKLVLELIRRSRKMGKRGLFALTVNENVGEFFQQMEFTRCNRESLPKSWQANYDFSRPSEAFFYEL